MWASLRRLRVEPRHSPRDQPQSEQKHTDDHGQAKTADEPVPADGDHRRSDEDRAGARSVSRKQPCKRRREHAKEREPEPRAPSDAAEDVEVELGEAAEDASILGYVEDGRGDEPGGNPSACAPKGRRLSRVKGHDEQSGSRSPRVRLGTALQPGRRIDRPRAGSPLRTVSSEPVGASRRSPGSPVPTRSGTPASRTCRCRTPANRSSRTHLP